MPKDSFLSSKKAVDVSHWIKLNQEWAGTREKYILVPNSDARRYLIKFPEYGENEILIELFNCYLALNLNINVASYFPCHFYGKKAIITKSFLDHRRPNVELWEMKDLICEYAGEIDIRKNLGRDKQVLKEHDIDNIYMILNEEFGTQVLKKFFQMIGFDCLIGHSDRHWENYGIVLKGDHLHNLSYSFAPLYDTATSYLVGWSEDKIKDLLKSGELDNPDWYRPTGKKNTCRITVSGDPKTNHFDLLNYIVKTKEFANYLTSLIEPVKKFDIKIARHLLSNYCSGLSADRKSVIIKILTMRHKLILEFLEKEGING